jgi:hypothetical protein
MLEKSLKSIAAAARALPPEQQAELIDELVIGLSRADEDWSAAWSKEAGQRWSGHVAAAHPGHAADDVLADIAALLEKRRHRS